MGDGFAGEAFGAGVGVVAALVGVTFVSSLVAAFVGSCGVQLLGAAAFLFDVAAVLPRGFVVEP